MEFEDNFSANDLTVRYKYNIAQVQKLIEQSCVKAKRASNSVRLLPVTKTISESHLRCAYAAGCRNFAENKTQEAWQKYQQMQDLSDLKWTIIGHLQTNKAKYVAKFASEFHGLDNLRIAQELDKRLQQQGRSLDVLIQVNTSGEESKFGLPVEKVLDFARQLTAFNSLKVKGLMTLAIFSPNLAKVRQCFINLRDLRDKLRQDAPGQFSWDELSMGMSGDFAIAIEEGATIVRIGQAIFGKRIASNLTDVKQ